MTDREFIAVQAIRDGAERTLPTFLRIADISAIYQHDHGGYQVELRNRSSFSVQEQHAAELLAIIGRGAY